MWVTDQVINFFYEYLNEYFQEGDKIKFLDPACVALMYHMTEIESLFEVFMPLKLDKADVIFCPINDNQSPFKTGGTHWALLVYLKATDSFHYFDSAGGEISNRRSVASKLRALISRRKESYFMKELSSEVETFRPGPRQENSYDCGLFVMATTLYLVSMYKANRRRLKSIDNFELIQHVNQDEVGEMRQYIRDLIFDVCCISDKYTLNKVF
ncbi:unnamed protein product [Moneuplotes crassus]|uniref:Ubiquitin-like protease family profile domain-containing protein n=1 Tax=Euplotes crassus TaxID=5936 RepID=A0AAD1XS53_EUPCR|nr:unnamed protein product [Moneuplotes crassus]